MMNRDAKVALDPNPGMQTKSHPVRVIAEHGAERRKARAMRSTFDNGAQEREESRSLPEARIPSDAGNLGALARAFRARARPPRALNSARLLSSRLHSAIS